jgi:hypothetical protein
VDTGANRPPSRGAAGAVVKLQVVGWDSRDPLYVAYNTEKITRTEQRMLIAAIESGIASIKY